MPSVCFYFQVHQPFRIKQYSFFNIGNDHQYDDEKLNISILNKVADKCYIPTNKLMLELIRKNKNKFKISYSISGVVLEQFEKYRPDVLESFIELSRTGCVEFLSETYYHSLSFLYSKDEFVRQVTKHKAKMVEYFNQSPTIFRNTELIYSNELAAFISSLGYKGILCEGVDWLLNGRTPNSLYTPPSTPEIACLLKNFRLSDDIAFRFSNHEWPEYPLTASKFAGWLHKLENSAENINLFMDYETFGEHQWEGTGIFDFLKHLPEEILMNKNFDFKTPSEIVETQKTVDTYDVHNIISWADTERDLSAWLSNSMQEETLNKIYKLEAEIKKLDNKDILDRWSKLQISDHFYYMCTKYWGDGVVHKYFSPYNSPYDSYIYYINVLSDLELLINQQALEKTLFS